MSREYILRRKVFRLGNPGGLVITLPKVWVEATGLVAGHEVLVVFDEYEYLKVMPVYNKASERRNGSTKALISYKTGEQHEAK